MSDDEQSLFGCGEKKKIEVEVEVEVEDKGEVEGKYIS